MPYRSLTGLQMPDEATTVWRYMDFWKFESIIKKSALYFVRSDNFSDSDPWDSVLPPKWKLKMQQEMVDRPNGGKYTEAEWYEEREIPTNLIHCWNCDEKESIRMWSGYTKGTDALVIRSTVGRLKECFTLTPVKVLLGLVNYGYYDDLNDPEFITAW